MVQLKHINDTIVAISTPPGIGAIGIVRLSGPQAIAITERIFLARDKGKLSQCKSHTIHYGHIVETKKSSGARIRAGTMVDEVLVAIMRAPRSYTCEDVVEINCHGGMVPLKAILRLSVEAGARLAEPGEFTKRAFLNGRIDLTQAEAVLDIIHARTDAFLRVSTNQLKGELTERLESIRSLLMEAYVEIEAALNFPQEDLDLRGRGKMDKMISRAKVIVEKLLESSEQGKMLKEGVRVVICGRTNVGKSSLLNVLVKEPRAIVSPIAGTTRDTLEETIQMEGIPLSIVDTAGILQPRDVIEEEAVKRSRMYMQGADLVLFVLDGSQPLSDEDKELARQIKGSRTLVVLNKSDLAARIKKFHVSRLFPDEKILDVSALRKKGIGRLKKAILSSVLREQNFADQSFLVSNMRHIESLTRCVAALKSACDHSGQGLSLEFISEDLKCAINELDRITGQNADQDLLEQIFSSFCIGK